MQKLNVKGRSKAVVELVRLGWKSDSPHVAKPYLIRVGFFVWAGEEGLKG